MLASSVRTANQVLSLNPNAALCRGPLLTSFFTLLAKGPGSFSQSVNEFRENAEKVAIAIFDIC